MGSRVGNSKYRGAWILLSNRYWSSLGTDYSLGSVSGFVSGGGIAGSGFGFGFGRCFGVGGASGIGGLGIDGSGI